MRTKCLAPFILKIYGWLYKILVILICEAIVFASLTRPWYNILLKKDCKNLKTNCTI